MACLTAAAQNNGLMPALSIIGDLDHPGNLLEALLAHVIMRAHRVAGSISTLSRR